MRDLLAAGELPDTIDGLTRRATECGWSLSTGAPGELDLVVPNSLSAHGGVTTRGRHTAPASQRGGAPAADDVVVDEPRRLHEGVGGRRTHEPQAAHS